MRNIDSLEQVNSSISCKINYLISKIMSLNHSKFSEFAGTYCERKSARRVIIRNSVNNMVKYEYVDS